MLKVLHVIPNLVKGGAQRIAIDICKELSKRQDTEVILVYFEGDNEYQFLTQDLNVQKISVHFELSVFSKNKIDLSAYELLLDQFKPDVIHSHLYQAELITRENPSEKVKYVTHCHDNVRQYQRFHLGMLRNKQALAEFFERLRLFKKYIRCNNRFIAISNHGEKYLESHLPGVLRKNIFLLYNAIDLNRFHPPKDITGRREKHKLINVGNFISNKNQQFLIDVLEIVLKSVPDCTLTFIGDGVTKPSVQDLAAEKKMESSVNFEGRHDDVGEQLRNHSIYVHAAKSEQFGLVLLEAMATGLPSVSLDAGGNKEVVRNNVEGFVVPQNEIQKFADCVIDLLQNDKTYLEMSQAALQRAKEFDIKPYIDKLTEIYSAN